MHDWLRTMRTLRRAGTPAVLVTVASVKGSVPRGPGTKMLVTADALHGTIGGGHLEFVAIDAARRMLADGATGTALHRFPLGASLGQCCGGLVNLLLERIDAAASWVDDVHDFAAAHDELVIVTPLDERGRADGHGTSAAVAERHKLLVAAAPVARTATAHDVRGTLGDSALDAAASASARELLAGTRVARIAELDVGGMSRRFLFDPLLRPTFDIVLFGAGHVARALVNVLAGIPCAVTWIDSRDDALPATLPANVRGIVTDAPEAEVDTARPGAYFLVMTHSHAVDETLTERILLRTDFAYFGLIGSHSKRRQFERRLAARGMPAERFAAMTCPIGLPGVAGKEPGIIAVAVAAELLQRRAALASDEGAGTKNESTAATLGRDGVRAA
jgi:xanthine dehydrogenase accessory factor